MMVGIDEELQVLTELIVAVVIVAPDGGFVVRAIRPPIGRWSPDAWAW